MSSTDLFGDIMGGRGAQGRARAAMRGNDLRYNLRISLEEAFWPPEDDPGPHRRDLRHLQGHRRRGRLRAADLPDLLGDRQGARPAGLLHRRAHLPDLQRPGPDDQEPLQDLPGRRPRREGEDAFGQHPRGGGDRARASGSRARARPACAAAPRATFTSS
jgi:hypothetical protein